MKFFDTEENLEIERLTKREIIALLQAEGELQQSLFARARQVRKAKGKDQVTLRGVIEISNYCQKNCDYCGMRASNPGLDRYRLEPETILEIAAQIKECGIGIVFLQGGQDPQCDRILTEVIPVIKKEMNLSVLLCLGEKPTEIYQKYADLGADSYILKFETSDPNIYKTIAHTPLAKRLDCLRSLQSIGYQVGTGNIVGLPGQTLETLAEDILLAINLQPDFVSSSPFIPNQNTPLEDLGYGNLNLTLNTIALYRLALQTALIPSVSALEKIEPGGQLQGLMAGANVLTINFTPSQFRTAYAIYSRQRFIVSWEHALKTIAAAGLTVAKPEPLVVIS